MNPQEKARVLFDEVNHAEHPLNAGNTMTHNQRKEAAIQLTKAVLTTLNNPVISSHALLKPTLDYWNEVLIACNEL